MSAGNYFGRKFYSGGQFSGERAGGRNFPRGQLSGGGDRGVLAISLVANVLELYHMLYIHYIDIRHRYIYNL